MSSKFHWMARLLFVGVVFLLVWTTDAVADDLPKAAPIVEVSGVPSEYGFVAPPIDLSHLERLGPDARFGPMDAAPAAWDWRDHSGVTPIKDQNPYGACWAFSNTGSFESCVLINESATFDFSEMELIHCNPSGPDCNAGGNAYNTIYHYSRFGTAQESCSPYVDCHLGTCQDCPPVKIPTEWRVLNGATPDNAAIKDAIYNIGPVNASIWVNDQFQAYNGVGVIYSSTAYASTNHAVLLVGYDDSMIHSGGVGAWIFKNSWDTWWGEDGFGYIAYNSMNIGSWASHYTDYMDTDGDDVVIDYLDSYPFGMVGFGDGYDFGAALLEVPDDGTLTHAAFYVPAPGSYSLEVYGDWNGGSPTGQLNTTQTGSFARAGYYAVDVGSPISVSSGDTLTIVFGIDTGSYPYPVSYDNTSPRETNKSFLSNSGANGTWGALDAGNYNYGDIGIQIIIDTSVDIDTDGDGVPDSVEDATGCMDKNDPDTDGDGLCDGDVSVGSTCVAGEDMDLDGTVDATETDPCDDDTDGDLLPDGYEAANETGHDPNNLDPLDGSDGALDYDIDGNSNAHEYWYGSDIMKDGLSGKLY